MYLNYILASVLTAVILWTGTLLHDVRVVITKGAVLESAGIQSTFSQLQPSREHDCSRDEHIHDACLTSRFDKVIKQIASPSVVWGLSVSSFYTSESLLAAHAKRGPPERYLAQLSPNKIFLTKCSLLI